MKALQAGFSYRFSNTISFDDYSNQDLAKILEHGCEEAELDITPQLAARVSEQIGARRGAADFGNAGDVGQALEAALDRRAERISDAWAANPALRGTPISPVLLAEDFGLS